MIPDTQYGPLYTAMCDTECRARGKPWVLPGIAQEQKQNKTDETEKKRTPKIMNFDHVKGSGCWLTLPTGARKLLCPWIKFFILSAFVSSLPVK